MSNDEIKDLDSRIIVEEFNRILDLIPDDEAAQCTTYEETMALVRKYTKK